MTATAIRNTECGCEITTQAGDPPIKAWSCEHGNYWVSVGYCAEWVAAGRPTGIWT